MGCGGSKTDEDGAENTGRRSNSNKVKPDQVVVEVASTQNGSIGTAKGQKGRGKSQQSQSRQGQSQPPKKRKRQRQEHREPVNEKGYKRRIRENLRQATRGHDLDELQNCINLFEKNKMEDNGDLSDAYDRLEYLSLRKEIRDAILRRHPGILDKAICNVESSEYAGDLHNYLMRARELLEHLKELDKYRHDILNMEQNTISEIRSYHHPPLGVHEVMTCTYMILGYPEEDMTEWTDVQCMLGRYGKESLLREVKAADTVNLNDDTCKRVAKLQENYTPEQIRVVSAGVATFYEWNEQMCQKYTKDQQTQQQRSQSQQQQHQPEQQENSQASGKSKQNRRQNKG